MSLFRAANNVNKPSGTNEGPYPINRSIRATEGPAVRIVDRPRRRDRLVWLGLLVALFALVTSSISGLAAWQAMKVSRLVAMTRVPAAAGGHADAGTGYHVTYAQEPLKVQVGCSAVLFMDLDEPRSNADERVSDMRYDSRCGTDAPRLSLGPGAAAGAEVKDLDLDAAGCERAIRTSPIGPGGSVQVRKGAVLCVLTAADPAAMALVEVTDVGRTGTAGMRATSWKVAG
ncbi:hypothetical protein GCM10010172_69720 [Paractinoplanes ferrugineus]|uniref:Uncharacterized protein n=1 Tax=Paractinoplanes ferrugineus TaxID=113564 RepID=A0A919J3K9_9ACTN|nr:hypothetical protein [Actinoplanes ferrugineus]GIE12343.1 hypothetical protein Afe05nite_41830 [Actinoplanes ferrugineus]